MLSVHPVLEHLVLRVNIVKDGVSIGLVRCREYYHLKIFVSLLETLHEVWSEVDTGTDCLLAWEVNFKNYVWVLCLDIINTVDECLVHIENQNFLVLWVPRIRQEHKFILDELFIYYSQVVLNELEGSQSVLKMLSVKIHLACILPIFLLLRKVTLGHLSDELSQDVALPFLLGLFAS